MICPRHQLRRDSVGRCTGCVVEGRPRHVELHLIRSAEIAPAIFDWADDPELNVDLTPPHGVERVDVNGWLRSELG